MHLLTVTWSQAGKAPVFCVHSSSDACWVQVAGCIQLAHSRGSGLPRTCPLSPVGAGCTQLSSPELSSPELPQPQCTSYCHLLTDKQMAQGMGVTYPQTHIARTWGGWGVTPRPGVKALPQQALNTLSSCCQ